jgi:hypothetical protein
MAVLAGSSDQLYYKGYVFYFWIFYILNNHGCKTNEKMAGFSFPLKRWKSLNVIKEINRKGPYLGLVTVYPPEEKAFLATGTFKPHRTHPFVDLSGLGFLPLAV